MPTSTRPSKYWQTMANSIHYLTGRITWNLIEGTAVVDDAAIAAQGDEHFAHSPAADESGSTMQVVLAVGKHVDLMFVYFKNVGRAQHAQLVVPVNGIDLLVANLPEISLHVDAYTSLIG